MTGRGTLPSRPGTRRRLGFVAATVLLLSGCGSGPAPLDFPRGQSAGLVAGALSELEDLPFLSFTGRVDDFAGGNGADISVGITEAGLMYGTAQVDGAKMRLLSVDGKYFVNADKDFWDGYEDYDKSAAKRLGGDWTPVDPKEWFDPASVLVTGKYTSALKAALREMKAPDSWRPEPTGKYGDRCHPFKVKTGTVCVSTDKPHRITFLDDVSVSYGSGESERSASLDLELASIDADAVKDWAKDLRGAVKGLSPVYAFGGVSMVTSSDGFNCSGTTCAFSAYMGVEELPDFQAVAKKVRIGFKGVARTSSGRSESCDANVTVKVGASMRNATCSVTFSLRPGESQQVSAEWQTTGLMTFKPDTGDLGEQVKKGVGKVLGKL